MSGTMEWLLEYVDSDGEDRYDHIAERDHAIDYLRQLIAQGKTGTLYQRVPFEVQIGVTVKARGRRRKKEGTDQGAASPQAAEKETGSGQSNPPSTAGIEPASPVFCEANFPGDPACPGPMEVDSVTGGRFCALHAQVPEWVRHEMHRLHWTRNAPAARVA